MIAGGFAALSGVGYIVAASMTNNSDPNPISGIAQVVIAVGLAYCGYSFMRGSETMRKILKVSSYMLICFFLYFGFGSYSDFDSVGPLLVVMIYIIPLFFVIRALRSETVKSYFSRLET